MRIIFMGTPDFAVPTLKALYNTDHEIAAVFTQPDKPKGRGYKLTPPPVKVLALEHNTPVYQPESLKKQPEMCEIIKEIAPDCIVVAAYGKILPQSILDIPKYGCVNLHGSLLPKYRGAAPIQWCVINGEKTTGVTTMLMDAGLDTGDILLTAETAIDENETAGELFDRLAQMCPPLLMKTLEGLAAGTISPKKQNDADATYVGVLNKELAVIDWNRSAAEIHNKVRGMNPWPVAKTVMNAKTVKIFSGCVFSAETNRKAGELYSKDGNLLVSCGKGVYRIMELQLEGARRMDAADFLRGHPVNGVIELE